MKHEEKHCLVFLTLIAGRKQKEALLAALIDAGMHVINATYGRGTVEASYLRSALGLTPEERKVVITSVSSREKVDAVLDMLVEQFHFNEPNTGIAYTTRIDKVAY